MDIKVQVAGTPRLVSPSGLICFTNWILSQPTFIEAGLLGAKSLPMRVYLSVVYVTFRFRKFFLEFRCLSFRSARN